MTKSKTLAEINRLGKRAARTGDFEDCPRVTGPASAAQLLRPWLQKREQECLLVMGLTIRGRVIAAEILTVGSAEFTVVDTRQVLRWVLTRASPVMAFILAHNHPSGDPEPSPSDLHVTKLVLSGARAVHVPMLDHIIIGSAGRFISLVESGHVPSRKAYHQKEVIAQ